jgi:hypothetical protein
LGSVVGVGSSRLASLLLASLLAAACGGMEGADEEGLADGALDSEEQGVTVATISGRVIAMGEVQAGAVVIASSRSGLRVGRAVTGADGRYTLPVSSMPYRIAVKAWQRVPRSYTNPKLTRTAAGKYRFDTDVGPWLGADGTSENLTYVVADAATAPRLVPHVAWGNGGGVGSPQDEVADLTVGPRVAKLSTLLPDGTRVVPNAEAAVERKTSPQGDYLEARFSEELNQHNLGSAYEGLLIEQIVATASINAGPERLPVRIRVRCATCSGGYTSFSDAHIGADGPQGSYGLHTARPEAAYSDLAGSRYARHVAMAKALGLLKDFASGPAFAPRSNVTRAEVASLLVRTLGITPVGPATASYKDVKATDWFYKVVETARAKGLMSGGSDGNFRPTAPVTRAELAAYVANAAKWAPVTPASGQFADVAKSYWAYSRIETAFGYCHAVEARDPWARTFAPAASATREEAAAAMARALTCFTGAEVK